MSIYTQTTWPVMNTAAVCALQNLSVAGPLLLNGTLANADLPNQISFITNNFIRSVSITSTNDLSTYSFVISGFQNEAFVTETISGPNNDTIFGTQYYDIVTSIVVSGAVSDVSVGTGNSGYLPLITVNTNNIGGNVNYSCSVLLPDDSGITYSLLQSLASVQTSFIALQNQTSSFFPIPNMSAFIDATTSQIGNSVAITNYLLLEISSTTPITDTLNFIFLQE